MHIVMVQPVLSATTETFLRSQQSRLPADVSVIHHRFGVPHLGDQPMASVSYPGRALRKMVRKVRLVSQQEVRTRSYRRAFRMRRPDGVLAQYGPTGVQVAAACRLEQLPLVVHFHGYDASKQDLLERMSGKYRQMFWQASGIIAVSRAMERKLVELGAPRDKLYYNPYGVDCNSFEGADPRSAGPTLLAVGRFVEKKAPHLTLTAFAKLCKQHPDSQLRMIGDGPLHAKCVALCSELGIADSVTFLGVQSHDVVQREMRAARGFVQHSVVAPDGDSEGTPVAILEAGAAGLPVVATRHAGIPDVVIEGRTGFLVDEGDADGMADLMARLIEDRELAARMGKGAQEHITTNHTMEQHIERLHQILKDACGLNREANSANRNRNLTPC